MVLLYVDLLSVLALREKSAAKLGAPLAMAVVRVPAEAAGREVGEALPEGEASWTQRLLWEASEAAIAIRS